MPHSNIEFKSSPLNHLLTDILALITTLQETYKEDKKASPEYQDALLLINKTKETIALLLKGILPKFDQQNIPWSSSFIGGGKSLSMITTTFWKPFLEKQNRNPGTVIQHPITFEFIQSLLKLITDNPQKDLQGLAPFFNPKALEIINIISKVPTSGPFSSDSLSDIKSLLELLLGVSSFKEITHTGTGFTYKISTNLPAETSVLTLNNYQEKLRNKLSFQIKSYLENAQKNLFDKLLVAKEKEIGQHEKEFYSTDADTSSLHKTNLTLQEELKLENLPGFKELQQQLDAFPQFNLVFDETKLPEIKNKLISLNERLKKIQVQLETKIEESQELISEEIKSEESEKSQELINKLEQEISAAKEHITKQINIFGKFIIFRNNTKLLLEEYHEEFEMSITNTEARKQFIEDNKKLKAVEVEKMSKLNNILTLLNTSSKSIPFKDIDNLISELNEKSELKLDFSSLLSEEEFKTIQKYRNKIHIFTNQEYPKILLLLTNKIKTEINLITDKSNLLEKLEELQKNEDELVYPEQESIDKEKNEIAPPTIDEVIAAYEKSLVALNKSLILRENIITFKQNASSLETSIKTIPEQITKEYGQILQEITDNTDESPLLLQILQLIHEELTNKVEINNNISSLKNNLADLTAELETLKSNKANQDLPHLLEQYKKFNSSIKQIGKELQRIPKNSSTEEQINTLNATQKNLQEEADALNTLLNEKLETQLNSVEEKLNTLFSKISEDIVTRDKINTDLQKIKTNYSQIPKSTETFTKRQVVDGQLDMAQLIYDELDQRVNKKQTIIVQLKIDLNNLDDKTTKKFRDALANNLHDYLNKNIDPLKLIQLRQKEFPNDDIRLQALLNQITADLLDLNQNAPLTFDKIAPKIDGATLHQKAKDILKEIKKEIKHEKYVNSINVLYERIEALEKVPKAIELAKKLQHTLDSFVVQQDKKIPTKKEYNAFKYHFEARLHSKDDVLNKNISWKDILANIAIGVATLGIALGIKLIHTQRTEGSPRLFFTRTEAEKRIRSMQKETPSLSDILPDPPKSGG